MPDETWEDSDYIVPPHKPTEEELDFFTNAHIESLRKRGVKDEDNPLLQPPATPGPSTS